MNQLIVDAAVIGCKEAVKLALVWYVCRSFFDAYGRAGLMRPFLAGVAVSSALFAVSFFIPHDMAARETVAALTGYVFFLFFMAAIAFMFNPERFNPVRGTPGFSNVFEPALVVIVTALYFSPDIVGSSMFIREAAVLSERPMAAYMSGAGAFILSLAIIIPVAIKRPLGNAGQYLGLAELFVFLALVKFLGGGTRGFAELSLVSSVQQGLLKFTHDAVHQSLLFLMVPDHPLLVTTTWNFIGFFFSDAFASALALLILAGPMVFYLYLTNTAEVPVPEGMDQGAARRMFLADERRMRRRRSVMAALFALVVFASWYTVREGGAGAALELPKPRPMVAEAGVLTIPLNEPGRDLMDGSLHKFSVSLEGVSVNLLAIRRPDGKLAVALDACEICPPDGYGKSEGHLVCLYCMTPIPIDTLGRPGGCNPIPLEVEITDTSVLVRMDEIAGKWRFVSSGQGREGIR